MAFITTCAACQMGDHDRHQHVVQPVPEGVLGGSVCGCQGDCKPGCTCSPYFGCSEYAPDCPIHTRVLPPGQEGTSLNTKSGAWNEWFDNQWDLTRCIDEFVKNKSAGKGDGFRLALYASVVEHCAEALRTYIPDADMTSVTPPGVGDAS